MYVLRSRILAAIVVGLLADLVVGLAMLGFPSIILLVGAAAIGSGGFLAITGVVPSRPTKGVGSQIRDITRRSLTLLTSTAFFLFSALGLLALVSHPYQKPMAYYLFTSASAAALAIQIGLVNTRRGVQATLVETFLLALSLFGSSQLVFPLGIGGSDARIHIGLLVAPILQTGHIPEYLHSGFVYSSFPAHHTLVAIASRVLMVDPATAYYLFGFLVMSLPILIGFLICRSLFGVKAGLLAALLLSGSSYYIFWASHAAPLSFAVPVISTIMLLLLRRIDRRGSGFVILAVFLMTSLVFTHPYSSVIFGFTLLGLVVLLGLIAAQKGILTRHPHGAWSAKGMALLFLVLLLAHWMYYSSFLTSSVKLAEDYYQTLVHEALLSSPSVYDSLPLSIIFVNTLGDSVLISLAVIGFLLVISRRLSKQLMIVIAPLVTLLLLSLVGMLSNLIYLLPNRMYVFLQFLGLVPLAAFGLSYLSHEGKSSRLASRKRWSRLVLSAFLVGSFVFLSSTSLVAGFETRPFVGDQAYAKVYDTESERNSVNWVCRYSATSATIEIPRSLAGLSRNQLKECLAGNDSLVKEIPITLDNSIDIEALDGASLVMISEYDSSLGFQSGLTGRGKFGQGINQRLDEDASSRLSIFNKIYDGGVVEAFSVPGDG